MDDKINIVKTPAPVIYTPQEVACIFKEQLKTPAKVVTIEGVYRQNPKSGNYYGYFYDSLAAQNSNYEMTLVVPAALREKMKDGTLVQVSGVVSKELRNRCSIDLHFNVTRYDVIEENVISEDEQRLMSLQAEKSARGYRNVDGVLEAKLFRGEKPNICLLFARGTITDQDFKKGLEAARSHIDFVEENETFAQISQLRAKLGQLDRKGYDVIAIVRGGGSGIKEVFDMPDLIESVVNLSTPFVTGVGHPGEKPFIAKVADKDLGTPSLLGVYFKDLVNRVIDQREKSKAVLVEQVKKQFEERITASEKQNKELNEKIATLTKDSEANRKLHAEQMVVAQKQNKELQDKIVEMNKNAANAQKLHADQMVLSEKQNKELQNKITELNKSAENAQKLYKEQIEAMKKQHETTEKQVKMYEEQAKSFNENISKMQQTNAALQKSLTDITTQNAKSVKELADAKALATRLEEQLKQAERQSKPVGLYVVLVVLVAIILFLISN